MKTKFISLDLTPVAFVAAMVVLLSTMVAVSTVHAETSGGDTFWASSHTDSGVVVESNSERETSSYSLSDVKSVVTWYVDPNPMMADEEYTKYIITLKNGTEFYIKQSFAPLEVFHEAIEDTGYTGDIESLLDLVVEKDYGDVNKEESHDDEDEDDEAFSLREQIEKLQARLQTLLKKSGTEDFDFKKVGSLLEKKTTTDDSDSHENVAKQTKAAWCNVDWNRPLRVGDRGQDVLALQKFLNSKGITVAQNGEGAPGFETDYFGPRTAAALARLQEKYSDTVLAPVGLTRGSGYFGDLSQRLIQGVCGGDEVPPANDEAVLRVTTNGLTAKAHFNLSGGCKGYEIDWGDGETDEEEGSDGPVCTMIYRMMALDHTYDEAGEYEIELTLTGGDDTETVSKTIEVDEETKSVAKYCTSGEFKFRPGTRAGGYVGDNGTYTSADSGVFVCADGVWKQQ